MRTPMKTYIIRTFIVTAIAIILGTSPLYAQFGKPAPTPTKSTAKHPLDKGDFKVGFSPKTKRKNPKKDMPKDEKAVFQEIATELNAFLALPRDVYLNLDTCDEANAYYSSETSEITICYELIEQYEEDFRTIEKSQKKVDEMVEDTLVQTLFHELGHCLIDVWELPATGREEDAVDQLATILVLDGSPEGSRSAINAARQFEIASRDEDPEDMLFWDEHSFSKTRFYDMLCLVYGSNPKQNKNLVGPNRLPAERAERCSEEYRRAERSWLKLLAPYVLD